MFRHQNHHPTFPNNEYIYKIDIHGGHFEIQDGGQNIHLNYFLYFTIGFVEYSNVCLDIKITILGVLRVHTRKHKSHLNTC